MNIVDWFYAVLIYIWSELDKVAVSTGLTALVVAVLRMRKRGKVLWSEALLCGIFGTIAILGIQFLLALIGVPSDGWLSLITTGGSTVIGTAIGWYGTDRTVDFIEDKMGGQKDETDE